MGGITTLLGANGAGKTTTLRAICNMVRTDGTIRFDGKNIRGMATEEIVRQRIAHVPEGRGTFTTSPSTKTCASPPTPARTSRR